MAIEAEALRAILKQHIKVDATGLSPAIASAFVTGFDEAVEAIRSALAEDTARAEGGTRLVPIKPTLDMQNAGWREIASQGLQIEEIDVAPIYAAMLAAAPTLPLDKEAADANR